jgi:phosphoribosylanthranilate isomerase
VNETIETILSVAETVNLDSVQLHGDETPEFAASISSKTGLKVIKAFRVSRNFDAAIIDDYKVDAILLDSFSDGLHGGTGEKFDWEIAKALAHSHERLYLAGGVTPENISAAIKAVRPYAVDVCSGVESVKGRKDPQKMRNLFRAISSES